MMVQRYKGIEVRSRQNVLSPPPPLVGMIWEEYCLLPKNGRSGARRSAGVNCFWRSAPWKFFWALGARRTAGVVFFLRSTPWKFFGVPLTCILILEYNDCQKNFYGAFNIQAYKHFWEKICIGFSIFKIFSKKKSRKIFRENCLLKISGRSAPGAREYCFLDHSH